MKQQLQHKNTKNTVLIVGNGISRLNFHDYIEAWKGEMWGCNLVFLEYGHKLTRITGHMECMAYAKEQRELKEKSTYEIYGGHILGHTKDKDFTCPDEFLKDSGTTMIAQALHEGFNVEVVGFDLGGLDVYVKKHNVQDKSVWINRWRNIIKTYGSKRIEFIGHDHKPFLLSDQDSMAYYNKYSKNEGKEHIGIKDYDKALKKHKPINLIVTLRKFYVSLLNVSQRDYTIKVEDESRLVKSGEILRMPEHTALKFVKEYKGEFKLLKENKNENF